MKRGWPLLLVLLLAACAGLPSSGSVQEGLERAPEPEGIVFLAPDPQPGGEPQEIVSGFLDAATAGVADRYETAQKYLTDTARRSWVPGAGVTIYSGTTPPQVELKGPGKVTVTVPVAGHVDQHGVYTEEEQGAAKVVTFSLTQVRGQWRISDLDDGVLISAVNFGTQYRQVSLSYFSIDRRFIIPDPRWFPEQNAATFAVNALLQGPAPWLQPGVFSAVPASTTAEPVNVSEGTAEVGLSQTALRASPTERELVVMQLEETLTGLPQVRRVRTMVDGGTYFDGQTRPAPETETPVGHAPVVLTSEGLATVSANSYTPIEETVIDPGVNYTALAVPYGEPGINGLPFAARIGGSQIETIPDEGSQAQSLIEGRHLLPPSYDPYGWLWSGEEVNSGTLLSTTPGSGVVAVVDAPLLRDHQVRMVRVSRDGSRIAVVQEVGDHVEIHVAIIFRDDEGTPLSIGEPSMVGSSIADVTDLAWVDAVTLAVLGSSDGETPTVHTVPLNGPSVALLSVQGSSGLTAGKGERELWIATADGELYNRAGNGWRAVGEGQTVHLVAFPG